MKYAPLGRAPDVVEMPPGAGASEARRRELESHGADPQEEDPQEADPQVSYDGADPQEEDSQRLALSSPLVEGGMCPFPR